MEPLIIDVEVTDDGTNIQAYGNVFRGVFLIHDKGTEDRIPERERIDILL